jgi:hypothetical protein
MAFKRYANALVSEPGIHFEKWMDEARVNSDEPKFKGRVASSLLRKCDPAKYLLSHVTIVASVDTYAPKGFKTGRRIANGIQIDVKFPDIRVKPECHKIINNNGDFWSRPLLLATYKTFIGAQNYLEHIQVPELSKGLVVDAVARDTGNSVYIDILVATERKHKILIADILSGKMGAMSMGCVSALTICSKCGNVAVDDSELCSCIQFDGKGSLFTDENGVQHPIAEAVGHHTVPNSNQFIEASWVANPAFTGAVRRNLLNPDATKFASKFNTAVSINDLKKVIIEYEGMKKVASIRIAEDPTDAPPADDSSDAPADDPSSDAPDELSEDPNADARPDDSGDGPSDESGDDASADATPADKMKELLEKAQEMLLESIVKGLDKQMKPRPEDVGVIVPPSSPTPAGGSGDSQDNVVRSSIEFNRKLQKTFKNNPKLIKWASWARSVVASGKKAIAAAELSSRDLLVLSWIEDEIRSRKYPTDLYKVALNVGAIGEYPSEISYLAACKVKLGRVLTPEEKQFFRWKGRIASLSKF